MRAGRSLAALFVIGILGGCASFSEDGGFGVVEDTAAKRLDKQVVWARTPQQRQVLDARVAELLQGELTRDAAIQVALLNNRELQAAFDELGIAEAERVQVGRLPNPGFSFGKFERGDEREIERAFHLNLARLVFMPQMLRLETRRFERLQRQVAMRVIDLAARTDKAWLEAVAARETERYRTQVQESTEVGADLARRMAEIGNYSKLQQAREQSFYAEATAAQSRARLAAAIARERLTRLMGLYGDATEYRLPERLPDLPDELQPIPDVVKTALAQRLDVEAARIGVEQVAANLGLVRTNRFFNVFEVAWVNNSSNDEPTQTGWEVGFELPIFDWGGPRVARAEAQYRQAVNQAAQVAIEARSEVRQAYLALRTAYDVARHYRDEIVPLRMRISEENLYRYNGMFIGVFELLADARAQVSAVEGYLQALREFWAARAELDAALVGKPALTGVAPGAAIEGAGGGAAPH